MEAANSTTSSNTVSSGNAREMRRATPRRWVTAAISAVARGKPSVPAKPDSRPGAYHSADALMPSTVLGRWGENNYPLVWVLIERNYGQDKKNPMAGRGV